MNNACKVPNGGLLYFGIGEAVKEMWDGARVTRANWNGPDQYLEIQAPDSYSKMSLPYIFITTVQGDLVPWLASQTDILATDWHVVAGRPAVNEVYGSSASV